VSFLVLWYLSVGISGTQRGIIRSYAGESEEFACPRGLSIPPMVGANPHADNDPPRRNDPGRGCAVSSETRDRVYSQHSSISSITKQARSAENQQSQRLRPAKGKVD